MTEDLTVYLEELKRILPDVDAETLETELSEAIKVYGLSPTDARRTLVRKHGGDVRTLSASERKLDALEPFEVVSFTAKVISINDRVIQREDGDVKMFYGILGDEVATRPFTAWVDHGLQRGDVIEVIGGYVREWKGDIRLNIGESAVVRKLDIEMSTAAPVREATTLDKLVPGSSCTVIVRVLEMQEATVNTKDGPKDIIRGTAADESAKLSFTSWVGLPEGVGSVLRLGNAYVREWQGVPQLNIGENTRIEVLGADALPPVDFLAGDRQYTIDELAERSGTPDAAVTGIVVDIKTGSGLIHRCPECNRVLQKGVCMVHGRVEGRPDLRIKAIVDDGTGALTTIFPRALTEGIIGKDLDEAQAAAKENMDMQVVNDEIIDRFLMKHVTVHGNVSNDDFGLMMIVQTFDEVTMEPKEMAMELFSKLEAIQ